MLVRIQGLSSTAVGECILVNLSGGQFGNMYQMPKNQNLRPHFHFYKFIYLLLAALGLCCCMWAFSSCVLQLRRAGATLRCAVRASHCHGFSCCGAWSIGARASVVVAHRLQRAGSVVVAHGLSCSVACGISWTRARTHVPCIGRRILNHCATRKALHFQKFILGRL